LLYSKLVNSWSHNGYGSKINNRIRVKEGWRGNYDCAVDSKKCPFSSSITVSRDGISDPVIFIKTHHTCNGGKIVLCEELIDAKQDMIDTVKKLALEYAAARAPDIAAQVMRQFDNKYESKF
jgi:hypothetical protein